MRSALVLLVTAAAALSTADGYAADRFNLPPGPGRDLIYGHCQTCHDLQSVQDSAGIRRGAWDAVLDNMKGFGLRISDDQRAKILDYLGTYLGPKPPPAAEAQASAEPSGTVDGAEVFQSTCVACHGEDGMGKPDEFPPFAGNSDLFLSPDFPAVVALHGLEGPIEVGGASFDNAMPPFDFLSDAEIAAVVNYVRAEWGNDSIAPADVPALTADDVAAARKNEMSAQDVRALRKSLLP